MQRLAKPIDRLKPFYDVVVVGSGYGGGVAASRLARAGLSVCVIERGREYLPGDFPERFSDLRHEVQVSGGIGRGEPGAGLFDLRIGSDIHVLLGCGLGGGSLINAGVALQPDKRVFADPVWPEPIRSDGLVTRGFEVAAQWLQPATHNRAADMTKLQVLQHAAAGLGRHCEPAPVTISFTDRINAGGTLQAACTLCGDCAAGCNVGAKTTVSGSYLADAVAAGAEIFTEHLVDTVVSNERPGGDASAGSADRPSTGKGRWCLRLRPSASKRGDAARVGLEVCADVVVLAAGSLGSTEVLLRSRAAGLSLSNRLGQGFSANGDLIAFGYDADMPVNAIGVGGRKQAELGEVGATVSGMVEFRDEAQLDHQMIVQEGVLPSALAPLLPVFFVPGGRLLGAVRAVLEGIYKGTLSRTQTYFVVSHDSSDGQMELVDGRFRISWPDVARQAVYGRVDAMLHALCGKIGARYLKNPLSETVMGARPATAHPLGGCGMADSAEDGVVDARCRVFSGPVSGGDVHQGLYVVDGAIMPRSLGCNPLFTITALAERALMLMAKDLGVSYDAAPRPVSCEQGLSRSA